MRLLVCQRFEWHGQRLRLQNDELLWRANDVLGWVASGKLKLRVEGSFPLAQAAQAQIDLAGRKTAGKLLLLP